MNKLIKWTAVALASATLTSAVVETVAVVTPGTEVSAAKKKKAKKAKKKLTTGKVVKLTDLNIKITDWKLIPVGAEGNQYGDKPVIAFWYDVTNKTGKEIDPNSAWIAVFEATQDTSKSQINKLDLGMLPDQAFLDTQMETIKKGGTAKNAVAYSLDSDTVPVKLVASKGYDDKVLAKETIKIKGKMPAADTASSATSDAGSDTSVN